MAEDSPELFDTKKSDEGAESSREEESEDGDMEGTDSEAEEDEDEEEDEPKLKYARLTSSLAPVYRNGDATSSFLVAGDKMVCWRCALWILAELCSLLARIAGIL
jgi:hypothetical protein